MSDEGEGDRIRDRTAAHVNDEIDRRTERSVARYVRLPRTLIARRVDALDREWDIDRAVIANFAVVGGAAFALGAWRLRRRGRWNAFLTIFGAQLGFLVAYAIAGWCPPIPVLRRLGFRTHREILVERAALERLLDAAPDRVGLH